MKQKKENGTRKAGGESESVKEKLAVILNGECVLVSDLKFWELDKLIELPRDMILRLLSSQNSSILDCV